MHILHLNQRNQILFQYLRDKKRKERRGLRKKGGGGAENSPISPPLDPRLIREYPPGSKPTASRLGSDTLCRHNFEHNTMDGASSIMPA